MHNGAKQDAPAIECDVAVTIKINYCDFPTSQ